MENELKKKVILRDLKSPAHEMESEFFWSSLSIIFFPLSLVNQISEPRLDICPTIVYLVGLREKNFSDV